MKIKVDVRVYDDAGKSTDVVVEISEKDVRNLAEDSAMVLCEGLSAKAGRIDFELCW